MIKRKRKWLHVCYNYEILNGIAQGCICYLKKYKGAFRCFSFPPKSKRIYTLLSPTLLSAIPARRQQGIIDFFTPSLSPIFFSSSQISFFFSLCSMVSHLAIQDFFFFFGIEDFGLLLRITWT